MGLQSVASGYCAFATGRQTLASAFYGTALGYSTLASGETATSMGFGTSASGNSSTATGYQTSAGGAHSMSMGLGTISPSYVCVSLGRFNYSTPASGTSWVTTDPVLIVGNGTSSISRSNILEFYKDGSLTIWGTLTQYSDARLKTNINPLHNSLQKITKLNGYNYTWRNNTVSQSLQTGLIAQEVKEVMPELVGNNLKGELTLNYNGLIPHLIEAINELNTRIEILEERNRKLISSRD